MSKIMENFYLGNVHAIDYLFYDLIINCCPDVECNVPFDFTNVEYIKVYDDETESEKLYNIIKSNKILEKIHDCLNNKKNVLVHCGMGRSRSATIVACYLIKYHQMTTREAVIFIKHKHLSAFTTGYNFYKTMKSIEKRKWIF